MKRTKKSTSSAVPSASLPALFVGIDPGKTGAIALIHDNLVPVGVWDYPGDAHGLAELLDTISIEHYTNRMPVFAALELVNTKEGEGRRSAFVFGENFGEWRMALAVFGIPWEEVRPQIWQKGLTIPRGRGKPRDLAKVEYAAKFFPQLTSDLYGPRGGLKTGRADALLIARWRALR